MLADELLPTLPVAVASHTLQSLIAGLPAPVPDTPERRSARNSFAIAVIADMKPVDAAEAALAVQSFLDGAHAMECFRLSDQPSLDLNAVLRYRACAIKLMRRADKARRTLLQVQALRPRLQAQVRPAAPQEARRPAAANLVTDREAEARRQRAARIRALDLRVIEIPPTIH